MQTNNHYVIINDTKVYVEIADTYEDRQKGLMYRESLDEKRGMLFVFEEEDYQSFWMKNTLIPLEALHISKDMEVVDIIPMKPCKDDKSCISYKPTKKSLYVLEVSQGFSEKNGISKGDKVMISE